MTIQPVPGAQVVTSPTGQEYIELLSGSVKVIATAQSIANLATLEGTQKSITNLTTVGNGSVTAAMLLSGNTLRGGTQTGSFTDTTVAASVIIAALPAGAPVGTSFGWKYVNNTVNTATLAGGSGVTINSGLTPSSGSVIPSNSYTDFLVVYTSATAVTITQVSNTAEADSTDTTKVLGFVLSGQSTGTQVTLNTGAQTTSPTITLPVVSSSDTLTSNAATQTLTNKTITDAIQNGNTQSTATLTATSNTVLANIVGLTANVTAAGVYNVRGHLNGVAVASGGIKLAFAGSATATSSNVTTWNWNGTTLNAVTNQTTWGSAIMSNAAAYTDITFEGSIVVANGGNIQLQAAQNTSNGTSTTVLTGSQMTVSRVS